MLYYWKSSKQKLVYDTASGAVVTLSSLEYKMVQAITAPLPPLCPSSLRYELAKFDSADVEEAYERIYSLHKDGILFAPDNGQGALLRIGGDYGLTEADKIAREALEFLNGQTPEWIVEDSFPADKADEIKALA